MEDESATNAVTAAIQLEENGQLKVRKRYFTICSYLYFFLPLFFFLIGSLLFIYKRKSNSATVTFRDKVCSFL
jgi:hypothetical protein